MKKSRLQQSYIEIVVGLFAAIVIAALIRYTVLLSPTMGKNTSELPVRFETVTGLTKGDKVYLQGVDIGRVKEMEIDGKHVIVRLTLQRQLNLREGYRISVEPSSVLGGRFVNVDEGPATNAVIKSGVMIEGIKPIDFIRELSEGVKSIRSALEEGGILSNLKQTMSDVTNITADIRDGKGTLGKLITSDEAYNKLDAIETNLVAITAKIDHGDGTLAKLINENSVYTNLDAIAHKINDGQGTIGKLVNDDSMYTNLQAIASNLKEVSDNIAAGRGTIGKLFSTNETMYADLSGAVSNINAIAQNMKDGKGTLGKLMTDDKVYDDVHSLIGEIRAAVDDLRETSPVASFSSVFIGSF